jgi:LCP family protein required for cell wall assembly
MEYQPFDFDRLDRLLREFGEEDEVPNEPDLSGSGDDSRPPHPIDDGFGDPDPFSGWPTLDDAMQEAGFTPAAGPRRSEPHTDARRSRGESASARKPASSKKSSRRQEEEPSNARRSRSEKRREKAEKPDRRARRRAEETYDYDEPDLEEDEEEWDEPPRRRKKHRILRFFLVLIILLGATLFAILKFNLFQPTADTGTLGERKTGASTILIAGTDDGGTRTDTMMLVYVNAVSGELNLISIPRDTLVNASYNVPKLNSCYGVNGGGEEGMEALMGKVEAIIGFRPDGYVLTNLDAFIDLVDLMGGVEFDVPQDMYYNDPSQNLYIDLKAGVQTLNGEQAMGLVRYRSGYALADIQRTSVQRDFVSAAIDQWVSFKNIPRIGPALALVQSSLTTDLSTGNLLWLAGAMLRADTENMVTEIMPGSSGSWNGGSYYMLDPNGVAEAVNAYCNPYKQEVNAADLQIRLP